MDSHFKLQFFFSKY